MGIADQMVHDAGDEASMLEGRWQLFPYRMREHNQKSVLNYYSFVQAISKNSVPSPFRFFCYPGLMAETSPRHPPLVVRMAVPSIQACQNASMEERSRSSGLTPASRHGQWESHQASGHLWEARWLEHKLLSSLNETD